MFHASKFGRSDHLSKWGRRKGVEGELKVISVDFR